VAIDDQRAAVGFSVTLSSQLIAASMALLAVEGAYVFYTFGSRVPRTGFALFALLAALAIVVSIFNAGKGITKARNAGFDAKWSLDEGKKQFDLQAKFLLLALAFLVVTFSLSGPIKESTVETRVNDLTAQVAALRQEVAKLSETQSKNQPGSPAQPVNAEGDKKMCRRVQSKRRR
jgi:hypothetical protein